MRGRRGVAIDFVAKGTSMGDGDARMKASFATALFKVTLCLNFRTSFVPAALLRFRWY
jgi:hypothetical protein